VTEGRLHGTQISRRHKGQGTEAVAANVGRVVSIFSSSESVIEDKTINDSIPADLFTVKVDFGIKFLDRRI